MKDSKEENLSAKIKMLEMKIMRLHGLNIRYARKIRQLKEEVQGLLDIIENGKDPV